MAQCRLHAILEQLILALPFVALSQFCRLFGLVFNSGEIQAFQAKLELKIKLFRTPKALFEHGHCLQKLDFELEKLEFRA